MSKKIIYIFCVLALLQSCVFTQTEIGKIEIESISTDELKVYESTEMKLKNGDEIHLWSKIDIKYEDNPELLFQVQILNDKDEVLLLMEMDPMKTDTRIMCFNKQFNSVTDYSCEGRIDDYLKPDGTDHIDIAEDGIYKFKAVLTGLEEKIIELKDCKLIIKK